MSKLIDDLIQETKQNNAHIEYEFGYFTAKPYDLQICSIPTFFEVMQNRINDAIRILMGKSRAYHYMEDEYND